MDQTQVVRLGGNCPYLLICLTVSPSPFLFNPVNNSYNSKNNYSNIVTITKVHLLSSTSCRALPLAHSVMSIHEILTEALINSDFSLYFMDGKTGTNPPRSLPKAFS